MISNNPDEFNSLEFDVDIPWICDKVEYRVTRLSLSNMQTTTHEDIIAFIFNDTYSHVVTFEDKNDYDEDTFIKYLNNLFKIEEYNYSVTVAKTPSGVLQFVGNRPFKIVNITHRVKLLLGLIHYDFEANFVISYTGTEPPTFTFNNILYLRSMTIGHSVRMQDENSQPKNPDLLYIINEFMIPQLPMITNKKGLKIIHPYEPKIKVKITLTDVYLEPIVLRSPLFVNLQIRPLYCS
jgi:hypothetical protein